MEPAAGDLKKERLYIAPSDEMLLEKAVLGDLEAVDEIYIRYQKLVSEYAFFLALEEKDLYEKISYEAFARFFERIRSAFFEHKINYELLRLTTDIARHFRLLRKVKVSETESEGEAAFKGMDFETRALAVLSQRINIPPHECAYILGRSMHWVNEKLPQVFLAQKCLLENPRFAALNFPDYRPALRSRIEKKSGEKDSYFRWILVLLAGGIFVFYVIKFYQWINPSHAEMAVIDVTPQYTPPKIPGKGNTVSLLSMEIRQEIDSRRIWNSGTNQVSLAGDDSASFPGRIHLDYLHVAHQSIGGIEIEIVPFLPRDFDQVSVWIKHVSANSGLGVLFEFLGNGKRIASAKCDFLSSEGKMMHLPMQVEAKGRIDKIRLTLIAQQEPFRPMSGQVILDKITLHSTHN